MNTMNIQLWRHGIFSFKHTSECCQHSGEFNTVEPENGAFEFSENELYQDIRFIWRDSEDMRYIGQIMIQIFAGILP